MNVGFYNTIILDETESTNNYANRLIAEGKGEEGVVVMSKFQSRGRGQVGMTWESSRGMNLLVSYILLPVFLVPNRQFYISKIISLAVYDWLSTHVENVSIKWPNDIYVDNKKIAGILIETNIMGSMLQSAIAGIGLNLNQSSFNAHLPNPVSLTQLTRSSYDIEKSAEEIYHKIIFWYEKLKRGEFSKIDDAYLNRLFRKDEWARYRKNNRIWEAYISGIGEYGQLLLTDRDGITSEFLFKEVEYIF